MVIRCPYPDIPIPEGDILSYLFGSGEHLSDKPLWIDAIEPKNYLSSRSALQWIKRLAVGLDKLGVKQGEVVMIVTPNQIFVPVAYLGIAGSGRIFSGANPAYTADGRCSLTCFSSLVNDDPFEVFLTAGHTHITFSIACCSQKKTSSIALHS